VTIVVQKYGGSSVADVEKIGRVADAVVQTRRAGHDVVVVVSAMGKTTDQLLALAREIDEAPPRRELDMLLTTGERVSMALLSMAIQKRGEDAISFTGSQSGIITNDRHFDARIIEVRPHRVEDELARGKVVIIAGYQGMSYRREITTLGRGGSDTTALAMAAALGAERAEIYSDVDGVYSADPRVVPEAAHLPVLDYAQMKTMSEAGAKVLHAGAVELAAKAKIAIHARATFAPGRETRVSDDGEAGTRAVVGLSGIAGVRVEGSASDVSEALRVIRGRGIAIRDVVADASGCALGVVVAHSPEWAAARGELEARFGLRASIEDHRGQVTIVGDATEIADAALSALDEAAIAPTGWSSQALSTTFVMAESQVEDAVRALHRALVTG
jgi:aspartate kinase